MNRASRTLMIAMSLLAPGLAAAQPAAASRAELERLQAQLDRSVAQVSRSSAGLAVGRAEGGRGYHLPGYGAVFVLAPRTLPRARGVVVLGHDQASGAVIEVEPTPGADRNRRIRIRAVGRPLPLDPDQARELAEFEAQVMAFQREAEEARQSAEREFEQLVRDMTPRAPVPPPPPAAPFPPPWRFWFESRETSDARAPEQVVADVRSAVISTLEAHGALVSGLGPDEHLAVAVDFLPGGAFVMHARPSKTLVVRARRKDLEESARGRLSPEELRKRIESVEY